MIAISNTFKEAMKSPVKELKAYIKIDSSTYIRSEDDLISIKVSGSTTMCKSLMRKVEASYYGDHNLLDLEVNVGFGVKLPDNTFEYLDYGTFKITEITYTKDTNVTKIVGYDCMIKAMKEYIPAGVYPMTLLDYAQFIANECGLLLGSTTINNANFMINEDLYKNISGITYRDIIVEIAKASGSTAVIGVDNKLYFKYITDTEETITYANLFKLKLEPLYGEINSVVLSRTPQEDNIYMKDQASITANGLTEFKIENNEIVDDDRQTAITEIYNALHGISYYPFNMTTEGLGWYEVCDKITVVNDTGDEFNVVLFNFSITIDGSAKEILQTTEQSKTQTQYEYASSIKKSLKNTELKVDKQAQEILGLIYDMYNEDGIVNESYSRLLLDLSNIILSIQQSGGNNLVYNSVGFAGNTNWVTVYDDPDTSILEEISSVELLENGTSGGAFKINGVKITQLVTVKPNQDYAFSCIISKLAGKSAYIKVYNADDPTQEWLITLDTQTAYTYAKYNYDGDTSININGNSLIIEYYGVEGADFIVTDTMLSLGNLASVWTQANGEILNTQVNINTDGVLVKSIQFDENGQYTIISPLEFAGYSNVSGVSTKVFTLNGDTTEMNRIRSKYQIAMYPVKVIPIVGGDNEGWAFVGDTGGGS